MAERIRARGADVRFSVVDPWWDDALWAEFNGNMERAGVRASLDVHRRASPEAADGFDDASLDFVEIDADHERGAVARDLEAWWPKLRSGGLMAGHDYTEVKHPGVKEAVDAFVARLGLGHAFRTSRTSWMLHKPFGIDAMYCINLASRPDRRRAVEEQFRAAGIDGRVDFFEAIDGKTVADTGAITTGLAGCALSHLAVMAKAKERGQKHVLVFEDDAELAPQFLERLLALMVRCPASYDSLVRGASCNPQMGNFLLPFDGPLARAGHVFGTHACVVNLDVEPRFRSALASLQTWNDRFRSTELQPEGNCYVCTPYLARQASGVSDIWDHYIDHDPNQSYVWKERRPPAGS